MPIPDSFKPIVELLEAVTQRGAPWSQSPVSSEFQISVDDFTVFVRARKKGRFDWPLPMLQPLAGAPTPILNVPEHTVLSHPILSHPELGDEVAETSEGDLGSIVVCVRDRAGEVVDSFELAPNDHDYPRLRDMYNQIRRKVTKVDEKLREVARQLTARAKTGT